MNDERLKKQLKVAEKYGAEAAYIMTTGNEMPTATPTGDAADIAELINNGTRRIVEGKDKPQWADRALSVDPFTNLPM